MLLSRWSPRLRIHNVLSTRPPIAAARSSLSGVCLAFSRPPCTGTRGCLASCSGLVLCQSSAHKPYTQIRPPSPRIGSAMAFRESWETVCPCNAARHTGDACANMFRWHCHVRSPHLTTQSMKSRSLQSCACMCKHYWRIRLLVPRCVLRHSGHTRVLQHVKRRSGHLLLAPFRRHQPQTATPRQFFNVTEISVIHHMDTPQPEGIQHSNPGLL